MRPNPWSLIRRLVRRPPGDADPVSDAELLARFARDRDQAAFELLVWRHGSMVLGACRRVLRDAHLAEDAFQAAFLILACKAGSVRAGGSVAGWLHRVARRAAIRAAKQHKRTEPLATDPPGRPTLTQDDELRATLDAEIDRLPDRFRLPVVLCYLDGRTTEDAARLLGVPRGTVLSRLATARQRLTARLTRRGITAPATLAAVAGAGGEVVSTEAVVACVSMAVQFASGVAAPGGSVHLAEGVLRMGFRKATAAWAAVVLTAAGLGTGIGVVAAQNGDGPRSTTTTASPETAAAPQDRPASPQPVGPGEERAKAAAENKARLQKAVDELTRQIEEKEKKLRADVRPPGLDPELVANELTRLSAEIARLRAESSRPWRVPHALRKPFEDAKAELAVAESAAVPDAVVQEAISRHPEVKRLTQAVAAKAGELAKATRGSKPDDPAVAGLKKQRFDLEKQLREAKDRVRPEVTEYLRCDQIVAAKRKLADAEAAFRSAEEERVVTEYEYREAVERYQQLSSNMQAIRSATEELQVLREIRSQLRRELLAAEYGLKRATAPASSDPSVEQLQAELEELKRELKRLTDARKK